MEINYIAIGKRIKEIRKKRQLTQEDLAEIIDKSAAYISYIETGKKRLSLKTLVDIANALKVTPDELLAYNILYRREVKNELSRILDECSTYEKKIITDIAKALIQTLKDNCGYKPF